MDNKFFMEKFYALSTRALVRRLEYCCLDKASWTDWISNFWRVSKLTNGWYIFLFLEEVDVIRVLEGRWLIGENSLVLCRSWVGFDPEYSRVLKWVVYVSFQP